MEIQITWTHDSKSRECTLWETLRRKRTQGVHPHDGMPTMLFTTVIYNDYVQLNSILPTPHPGAGQLTLRAG